ncbi:F-box/LRR-repeat protein 13-like [Chenopodium quinoa]|uniref:F-box domain-containing protein n=1 Tax=Chenopodium quinoa TaxID=63459 RepID=A0A803N0D5_CHEQI|nr:F-box/LRR-repeat protein 13-like [Chenopodium quinoa]
MENSVNNGKKRRLYPCDQEDTTNNGSSLGGGQVDRLSSLPNFLLGNILSRLPLYLAATTSILSRRWRGLWSRFATRLILRYCQFSRGFFTPYSGGRHKFLTIVDHILRQITSPEITNFQLQLYCDDDDREFCSSLLQSWFRQVCSQNAKKIEVKVEFDSNLSLIPLPICIFDCHSLIKLEFRGNFRFNLPVNRIITLPNLKKLEIYLPILNTTFIRTIITLLKSCPILEKLTLILNWPYDEFVMDICAPNLKCFKASMSGTSRRSRFMIDAPRLKDIVIGSSLACYNFVNHPGRLQKVNISFRHSTSKGKIDSVSVLSDFIQGISSISSLELYDDLTIFNCFRYMSAKVRPVFHNLTRLILTKYTKEIENESVLIPVCLLRKLKYIEISELTGDESDVRFVKYISNNANVLEQLHVMVDNLDNFEDDDGEKDQLWREYMFCRTLFNLSMRSSACEIEFEGHYIIKATTPNLDVGPSIVNYFGRQLSE